MIRYVVSPSLGDGQHSNVISKQSDVMNLIRDWLEDSDRSVGDGFAVNIVDLTEKEFLGLKDL